MSLGSQPSFDAMSTFPQGFANGVTIQGIPVLNTYPGRVVWLDSNNGSDNNRGTFARPFATLMGAQAYLAGQAPSVFSDVLMVKPGHSETITAPRTLTTTSGSASIDLSGLQVIGLGIWVEAKGEIKDIHAALVAAQRADASVDSRITVLESVMKAKHP